MNKQRKVVITTTYNEMGIIIDTKAEELGSFVQPEPCEDAVSRKAVKDGFVEMCSLICPYTEKQRHTMCGSCLLGTAFDVLEATQPVTPKQRTDLLKAEIKRMKRAFKTCINSDYYTGYMSALSAVEGYIAQLEGANNDT